MYSVIEPKRNVVGEKQIQDVALRAKNKSSLVALNVKNVDYEKDY